MRNPRKMAKRRVPRKKILHRLRKPPRAGADAVVGRKLKRVNMVEIQKLIKKERNPSRRGKENQMIKRKNKLSPLLSPKKRPCLINSPHYDLDVWWRRHLLLLSLTSCLSFLFITHSLFVDVWIVISFIMNLRCFFYMTHLSSFHFCLWLSFISLIS